MKSGKYYIYIYEYTGGCLYIGKTDNMERRDNDHKKKAWYKEATSLKYAPCKNEIDQKLYEIYYINKLNPRENVLDKKGRFPSIEFPELQFIVYRTEGDFDSQATQLSKPAIPPKRKRVKYIDDEKFFGSRAKKYINLAEHDKINFLSLLTSRSDEEEICYVNNSSKFMFQGLADFSKLAVDILIVLLEKGTIYYSSDTLYVKMPYFTLLSHLGIEHSPYNAKLLKNELHSLVNFRFKHATETTTHIINLISAGMRDWEPYNDNLITLSLNDLKSLKLYCNDSILDQIDSKVE